MPIAAKAKVSCDECPAILCNKYTIKLHKARYVNRKKFRQVKHQIMIHQDRQKDISCTGENETKTKLVPGEIRQVQLTPLTFFLQPLTWPAAAVAVGVTATILSTDGTSKMRGRILSFVYKCGTFYFGGRLSNTSRSIK